MILVDTLDQRKSWPETLLPILDVVTSGKLTAILGSAQAVWDIATRIRDKAGYHGIYEILSYDAVLELQDPEGHEATLTRCEHIRFLQDNIIAVHDHAWGNGEIFAEYICQPGEPVDFYEDGSQWKILISLRETKNRGDVMEWWIQRVIKDGFTNEQEWLETEIDHWTKKLSLSIIFPQERCCRRAILTRRSTSLTKVLDQQHFSFLQDGRQQLSWSTNHPKLHDQYRIKWEW